jgi:hypothetical protein
MLSLMLPVFKQPGLDLRFGCVSGVGEDESYRIKIEIGITQPSESMVFQAGRVAPSVTCVFCSQQLK